MAKTRELCIENAQRFLRYASDAGFDAISELRYKSNGDRKHGYRALDLGGLCLKIALAEMEMARLLLLAE